MGSLLPWGAVELAVLWTVVSARSFRAYWCEGWWRQSSKSTVNQSWLAWGLLPAQKGGVGRGEVGGRCSGQRCAESRERPTSFMASGPSVGQSEFDLIMVNTNISGRSAFSRFWQEGPREWSIFGILSAQTALHVLSFAFPECWVRTSRWMEFDTNWSDLNASSSLHLGCFYFVCSFPETNGPHVLCFCFSLCSLLSVSLMTCRSSPEVHPTPVPSGLTLKVLLQGRPPPWTHWYPGSFLGSSGAGVTRASNLWAFTCLQMLAGCSHHTDNSPGPGNISHNSLCFSQHLVECEGYADCLQILVD